MYSLAPEYSETWWIEKCSTLIGSGTTAWCLSSGSVVKLPFALRSTDSAAACRFRLPISPEFTDFPAFS